MHHLGAKTARRLFILILIVFNATAGLAQETASAPNAADPQSVFASGMTALEAGDLSHAIAQFERVLRLDPDANAVRVLLGSLYLRIDNPSQAEIHLRRAQEIGGMPPETEADVAGMLAEVERRQTPYTTRAALSFGVQSDTNANGGPDDTAAFTSGTADEDVAAVASAEFSMAHDLGRQDGRALNLTAQLYASEFSKSASPSSQYVSVGAGYVWPVNDASYVTPNLFASLGRLRGNPFRTQWGLGLDYVSVINPDNRLSLGGRIADETYDTASGANNPDRNGTLLAINGKLEHNLDPLTRVYLEANAGLKNARQAYQSFSSYSLGAGISRQFDLSGDPTDEMIVTAGLNLELRQTRYDAPDQINSTTANRDDFQRSITLFADYPVAGNLVVRSRVGWTDNRSNYATEDYDNLGVYLGATYYIGQ